MECWNLSHKILKQLLHFRWTYHEGVYAVINANKAADRSKLDGETNGVTFYVVCYTSNIIFRGTIKGQSSVHCICSEHFSIHNRKFARLHDFVGTRSAIKYITTVLSEDYCVFDTNCRTEWRGDIEKPREVINPERYNVSRGPRKEDPPFIRGTQRMLAKYPI